ncbi:septum site-determining protein MinC [Vibrio sp. D431a]|uniref:septum site-determining protein MinC n=1 Tax=Vibrio sp. D431a TaxID=2837388 RepID=UPI002553A77A|nr:septum site-determining protein MinC [Vibrio sp. D431a]MDK9793231.1 hypothetical protein [Vibrio sp. D431a]
MKDIVNYEFHEMKAGKFYCQEIKVFKIAPEQLAAYLDKQMQQFPKVVCNLNVALNFKDVQFENDSHAEEVVLSYIEVITSRGHKAVGAIGFKPSFAKRVGLQPLKEFTEKTPDLLSGNVSSTEPEVDLEKFKPQKETPTVASSMNSNEEGKNTVVQNAAETKAEDSVLTIQEINGSELESIKVHKGTVRGGQTLMAEGDLLVIGNVANGAVVRAKGSVIVWGRLEGRVLAGTSDVESIDSNAHVVATHFCPELISVNGIYETNAGIEEGVNKDYLYKTTLVKTDKDNSKLEFFKG